MGLTEIQAVKDEQANQRDRWGEQNHDDFHWLSILVEEVGELAKDINDNQLATKELTQVVAVGMTWLECIKRRG